MNVCIITGGTSSERDISLISAATVQQAVESNGHTVEIFDLTLGYDELSKHLDRFDLCFPVLHGKDGEDGVLYRYLASTGIPYVGSDPAGSQTAFDKILFKEYCDAKDIRTAKWAVIQDKRDITQFGFPCVLKAANGGSSHEVALLFGQQDLEHEKTNAILQLHDRLFVETYLRGTEVTVGVLLSQALPVIEIVPPDNGWFDYANKYSGVSQEIPFAPSLSEAEQRRTQEIALRIHQDLDLGSFSRTDFIIANGEPYVLETNTPGGVGLTPKSLFPKAAEAAGISFEQFVDLVMKNARSS